jgi:hypothetical protein
MGEYDNGLGALGFSLQFSVFGSQFAVLGFQFAVLGSQLPVCRLTN